MTKRWPFDRETAATDMFESCIQLDTGRTALLLSDLHFGDGSWTDLFGDQDARLVEFLESQRQRVDTFVFLGDIFDLPQAWTLARIERAHPVIVARLRELARTHDVVFVRGNHDWSVPYEDIIPGARRTEAVQIGSSLAWHGHQLDQVMNPGAVTANAKTYAHAMAERVVRRRLVPPLELHDSAVNRVALSLAVAWAALRLRRAEGLRARARNDEAEQLEDRVRYLARSVCGDPADIYGAATRHVLGPAFDRFDTVVCGHTHQPGVVRAQHGTYVNTGTWTYGMCTCAVYDGEWSVRDIDGDREITDEHYATVPLETDPRELFAWWRRTFVGAGR